MVNNYLNNVAKGKKIKPPIVFQGGVSKNIGVVKAFCDVTGEDIITDPNGHLMGALGVAILSKKEKEEVFDFNVLDLDFETKGYECKRCPNHCEIIAIKKDKKIIDTWGNRCERGAII